MMLKPIIVEHKNHAQLRSARNILHVFITRNSDVCAYVRTEEHSISDGMALDCRPKVCCNVAW